MEINLEGHKELLDMWQLEREGAKFWRNVHMGLQSCGVEDYPH